MKVLFAIGDAGTSRNIAEQYYSLYGEKLDYKDVFYFKALLEEVRRDKTYDRIVIAEQLEPPQKNVVDAIDQMIFNNLDSITDELQDSVIIFICSDGRTKNDSLIGRLFNMGIYNLLMGDERDIVPLCGLIKNPRNKKEAKEYLKSNPAIGDSVALTSEEEQVKEEEIMNISKFFNDLRTPEDYLRNFAIVEEQYNEEQLKIITLSLRKNLRKGEDIYRTLYNDERFHKYCAVPLNRDPEPKEEIAGKSGILGFLTGKKMKATHNASVEMARNREVSHYEKVSNEADQMMEQSQREAKEMAEKLRRESEERRQREIAEKAQREAEQKAAQEAQLKAQQEAQLRAQQEAQMRAQQEAQLKAQQEAQLRAQQEAELRAQQEAQMKAQQEAQLKAQQEAQAEAQQEAQLRAQQEAQMKAQQEAQLKAQQEAQLKAQQEAQLRAQQEAQLRAQQEAQLRAEQERLRAEREALQQQQLELQKQQQAYAATASATKAAATSAATASTSGSMSSFIVPEDYKKVVAFVGTNKVGTSFIVNCLANLMAMKGVKTSILDMTKNRGMYWFYNDTTYKKADIVATTMTNLSNGVANPIAIGKTKNLTLYTTTPGGKEDNRKGYRHRSIVDTARKNCNLLIIDCDFSTPYDYLEQASEVYVVQDLDLLRVQETLNFFRDLKGKGMDWQKLRMVINQNVKCKVTSKKIIKNALTYYNDPSMTYTEEFDEIKKFVEIPLDAANYANYVESMQDGKLDYEKFTPELRQAMDQLSVMVYGLVKNSRRKGLFN